MQIPVLESQSPAAQNGAAQMDALVRTLRRAQALLRQLAVDDIISLLDQTAHDWSRPDHRLASTLREKELGFLTLWMRRRNLEKICDLSLHGDRRSLDSFRKISQGDLRSLKAQPRGLIVHWVAGNVPVLGVISVVLGLLTKNANLVKVPSSDGGLLATLLESIREVSFVQAGGTTLSGAVLSDATSCIYVARDDRSAARRLSAAADVRVAWGGAEAVEAIINLPRRFGTEDIVFGPKVSFAVVGCDRLTTEDGARTIARAIARDASAFDQRGCNSPHTVFVEAGGAVTPKTFSRLLATEMDSIHRRQPLRTIAPSESMEILAQRALHDMSGLAWYSEGMGWTVLFSESGEGLAQPCYARTIFVRPVQDVFEIAQFCSVATQTAGFAVGDRRLALAEALTARGVERCPDVGTMSLYDTPWDGLFPMDRMVRWVSA